MKYKYTCMECETEFDEPVRYTEGHGLDTLPFEEMDVCPNCGSSYYLPATYCDMCERAIFDEYIITVDNISICSGCYTKRSVIDV